ncbi:MAG: hypothetical protein CMF55_00235 [Legionellales bacterium]|nr:hypothetical protein [Legionellales bacterium]
MSFIAPAEDLQANNPDAGFIAPQADREAAFQTGQTQGWETMTAAEAMFFAGQLGFTDSVRGITQWAGYREDEMAKEQELLEQLMNHPEYGGRVTAAYYGGMFADPVGWALPVSRLKHFKTVKDFFTKALPLGAVGGAAAGAATYIPEGTESLVGDGEMTRAETSGLGAVLGTAGTPIAVGAGYLAKKAYEPIGEVAWNVLKQPAGASGTVGGLVGYNVSPDATQEDKWRNALIGATLGAGGGATPRLLDKSGVTDDLTGKLGDLIVPNYRMADDFIYALNKFRGVKGTYAKDWDSLVQGVREMPVAERKVLYRMLQDRKFNLDGDDFDFEKLGIASESRAKIQEYGQALVNLGVLDEKTFLKNIDDYLNTSYMKHEGRYEELFDDPMNMLYTSHHMFKMRGKVSDQRQFTKDMWNKGQTPDGTDRNLWEVIDDGKNFRVRRQWFKEEKLQMGEIEDAAYALHKTGSMMGNERALGEFFNDLSQSANVVKPNGFPGGVKVPKQGWGNLGGKTVDQRTWDNIKKFREYSKPGVKSFLFDKYKTANGIWKGLHTIMAPPVHFANIVSSGHMFDMANGDWADVGRAAKDMYQKSDTYNMMVEDGVFGSGIMKELNEGQREVLKMYSQSANGYLKRIGEGPQGLSSAMDWTTKIAKMVKRVGWDLPGQIYQFEDNIWRAALYRTKLNEYLGNGMDMKKARGMAARNAKEFFVDYDQNPPVLNALRQTALPFFSYTYGTMPRLAEVAAKNPAKYAKWAMIYAGLNSIGENMSDTSRYTQEEINKLQEPNPLFGIPGLPDARVDMPDFVADLVAPGSRADQQSKNVERWLPGGKFSMTEDGTGQIPWLPSMTQPSFGVAGAVGWPALGINQFQGTDIPYGQRTEAAIRNLLPNWPGVSIGDTFDTYAQQKVERADSGRPTRFGDDYSPTTARLSNAGIRIEPQDAGKLRSRVKWKYESRIKDIEKQIRKAKRETKYGPGERQRVLNALYAKKRKEQDNMRRRLSGE